MVKVSISVILMYNCQSYKGLHQYDLNSDNINRHANAEGRTFYGIPSLDKELHASNDWWERKN